MFRHLSIIPGAAILLWAASAAPAAPYYPPARVNPGGYNPGYFSSMHGGYYPGAFGGGPTTGGYYPGYFSGYPAGYGGFSGGYYPGYFSDLHTQSTIPSTPPPQTPFYGPPAVESSGGRDVLPEMRNLEPLDPSQTGGGALLTVHVPSDAEVWFDGDETKQRGPERDFKSPPLPVGRLYHYEIRARWKEGGKVVDETRDAPASANRRTDIDFTRPAPNAPAPK